MIYLEIARDYIVWHYTTALQDMFRIWVNYIWFVNHALSVKDVVLTLFAPWKRLQEKPVNPIKDLEGFASALAVNTIMRIVGLVIRLALIAIALLAWSLVIAVGIIAFLLWLFAPFFFIHAFVTAVGIFVA